jgi:hypothetical protein
MSIIKHYLHAYILKPKTTLLPKNSANYFKLQGEDPSGIELRHMLKKGQMIAAHGQNLSAAGQFYSLAA